MNFAPTSLTTGTILIGTTALLLWFLVRKKYKRVWYPLIIIFQVQKSRLPKIRLRIPPLLIFLCFCGATLAAILFSFRPYSLLPVTGTQRKSLYMFIDFSPSVQAGTNISRYRNFLVSRYTQLLKLGSIMVSTSHSEQIYTFAGVDEFKTHLQTLEFHPEGIIMASVLQKQLAVTIKSVDRIVVVSDRDKHTWDNFHWQHLANEVSVHMVNTPKTEIDLNLYLHRVAVAEQHQSNMHHLDIEIVKAGNLTSTTPFTLEVYQQEHRLAQTTGEIPVAKTKSVVRVEFSHTKNEKEFFVQIKPNQKDAISIDNKFFFTTQNLAKHVIILGDLYGERLIDDPLFQLHSAFEVLNFRVTRMDHVPIKISEPDLWVLAFGKNFTEQQHCPTFKKKSQPVWLVPQSSDIDNHEACLCYLQIIEAQGITCREMREILSSTKAQQIGGKKSFIWQKNKLTVFTLPPYAHSQSGLTHAGIPVLLRQLLLRQGLWQQTETHNWPRIADRFALALDNVHSNVPQGESMLLQARKENLPIPAKNVAGKAIALQNHRQDAQPWVRGLIMLAIIASLGEGLASVLRKKT